MHTYKIYFRFYLLLLPLCLGHAKMVASSEESSEKSQTQAQIELLYELSTEHWITEHL
jgi:hypothetical protein